MKFLIFLFTRNAVALLFIIIGATSAFSRDLAEIKAEGVLRHIGIPYANFVTGSGDGMDVELIKGFAKQIGVRYEYVKADWGTVVEDLLGRKVQMVDGQAVLGESVPVKGDLVANGFTILPWRQRLLDFSSPTFPSQIWFVTRADSSIKPIKPTKISKDIERVRKTMDGKKVLTLPKTCLDPNLYNLEDAGAIVVMYNGNLNELAPAVIHREAETTILDVPDALIALQKWPGKIKIIGPLSPPQFMGVGFAKTSPHLRDAFNKYFEEAKRNGSYARLVTKYYPTASIYFPEFFRKMH